VVCHHRKAQRGVFMALQQLVFVGAFHKTGTVLLSSVFRSAAKKLGLVFWPLSESKPNMHRPADFVPPDFPWDICFDGHCRFLQLPQLLVSIRDPRDVVISGASYHCKSDESALHVPRKRFGGRTYQQAISALPSDEEKLVFEMDHLGKQTIERMLAVDPSDPRIFITRLETLVTDYEFAEYSRIFSFLGFGDQEREVLLEAASRQSVFSGGRTRDGHVQDGRPAQWRSKFTPLVAQEFERRFPGAAERLGYEATFH
jgi:hypothetical protein